MSYFVPAQVFGAVAAQEPCPAGQGRFRSPVDGRCTCPPGTHVSPDPESYDCLQSPLTGRSVWFPSCTDAAGGKVPNCLLGFPLKSTALTLGAGLVLGLIIGGMR